MLLIVSSLQALRLFLPRAGGATGAEFRGAED